jgi:hypothetical protein
VKRRTIIWLAIAGLAAVGLSTCSVSLFQSLFQSLDDATKAVLVTANAAAEEFEQYGITIPALKSYATPEYYAALEAEGPTSMDKFQLLGGVTSIADCVLVGLDITNGVGTSQAACPAVFDRGKANLVMNLHNPVGGAWKISSLGIQI